MSLRLSPKHDLNPCIPICFFCQEDKNEILLLGKCKGDAEAPRHAVFDKEPCDKCQEYMKQGIILISVADNQTGEALDNPYRTGGWCVVKQEFIERNISEPTLSAILKSRICFIEDSTWESMGLPFPGEKQDD